MADVIYFDELVPIGTITNDKILAVESDPRGSAGFKATTLEIKNYVNDGRPSGKTVTGGTAASENLILESTSHVTKGEVQVASGTKLHANTVSYETLITDDNDFATKKYVDDHTSNAIWTLIGTEVTLTTVTNTIGATNPLTYTSHPTFTVDEEIVDRKYVDDHSANGMWQRIGTEISVSNGGDTINFGTAGVIKSGSFDSTNISSYDAHPTFTVDTEIVDKKYVDDAITAHKEPAHDLLTVVTPGQTAFTLSKTPLYPDKTMLSTNGQLRLYGGGNDYSITGTALTWNDPGGFTLDTTDVVQIWYEVLTP